MIEVAKGVVFERLPEETISMIRAISNAGKLCGETPVITGAGDEGYPEDKVHDRGYGLDLRIRTLKNAARFVEVLRSLLKGFSTHYVVLWGDPEHRDHIHIGFSWWFSMEEQTKRAAGAKE